MMFQCYNISFPVPPSPALEMTSPRAAFQWENDDLTRPFLAVVEKQGACKFQIKPAADGAPYLYGMPIGMADSSSQV